MQKKLNVTEPYLPPLEEFIPYLEKIWDEKRLTNNGPYHQQFEAELADYLGVPYVSLFANGTLALLTALQTLRISGEVITTPYSFVATAHSLVWNNIKPVFADVDSTSFTLDPDKIEAQITPQTSAIMPVHCYGNPCNVERIQSIADTYGLKVLYDAAHAFGVRYKGKSLLTYGDLSVLSFHATKVFNTFEGGAIVCPDAKTKQRIDFLKNFGFANETTVVATGINGKMSEINAAFGLLQLKHIDIALAKRKELDSLYRESLRGVDGIAVSPLPENTTCNYPYFPILIGPDYPMSRDSLYFKLREGNVFSRRYFFPLISDMPMYRGLPSAAHANLPNALRLAEQVLCLPLHPGLTHFDISRIVALVKNA
jgi:dTDP-4-amino-4,6-dideoxygalactose transaminase